MSEGLSLATAFTGANLILGAKPAGVTFPHLHELRAAEPQYMLNGRPARTFRQLSIAEQAYVVARFAVRGWEPKEKGGWHPVARADA